MFRQKSHESARVFISVLIALTQVFLLVPSGTGATHQSTFSKGETGGSAVFEPQGGEAVVVNLSLPGSAYVLNATLSIEGISSTLTGGRTDTTDEDFWNAELRRNITIAQGSVSLPTASGHWCQTADAQFGLGWSENIVISGGVKLARGARFTNTIKEKPVYLTYQGQSRADAAVNSKGELVLVWEDYRSQLNLDIYVRRYDSSGAPLGSEILVSDKPGHQMYPCIVFDQSDNFYIVWQDGRAGDYDIFGQRYDSSGNAVGNEFAVCNVDRDQCHPSLCVNSAGKLLAVWDDYRGGETFDVYGVVLNADGTPAGAEVVISASILDQMWPAACALGSGFAVVYQNNSNITGADLEMRLLDLSGAISGAVIVVTNTSHNQSAPRLAPGAGGKFILVWEDSGSSTDFDIRARWYDSSGNVLSTLSPCVAAGDQRYPFIRTNSAGETVIAWEDERSGVDTDVYFKRYDSSGNAIGTEGMACNEKRDQSTPAAALDSTGAFFVAWSDWRDGAPQLHFGKYGAPRYVYSSGELVSPRIPSYAARFGSVGLCVTLPQVARAHVNTTGYRLDILDGREDNLLRSDVRPGEPLAVDTRLHDSIRLRIRLWTSDENITPVMTRWSVGTGMEENFDSVKGAIQTGTRYLNGEVVLQKDGAIDKLTGDVPVKNTKDVINDSQVAVAKYPDQSGDYVAAYQENNSGSLNIYARKFARDGAPRGSEVAVCTAAGVQENPSVAVDLNGQWVITWSDNRTASDNDIWARRFDTQGNAAGAEFLVCGTVDSQKTPKVACDLENNFIIVWVDCAKVYTLTFMGKYYPDATPFGDIVQVSWTQFNLLQPAVATDSQNRIIITWSDYRGGGGGNYDIYARNFWPDLEPVHPGTNYEIAVCEKIGDQWAPSISVDRDDNFIVVYGDTSNTINPNIYGRKFDWNGTPLTAEFPVVSSAGIQEKPAVAFDSFGNFLAAWQYFGDAMDIIGRYFGSNGAPLGPEFIICNVKNVEGEAADQTNVRISCGPDDEFVVVWEDVRPKFEMDVWAKVYGFPRYQTSGTYLSPPYDLGCEPTSLDGAGWNASTPSGTSVNAMVRTSHDRSDWTGWEDAPRVKTSFTIETGRYVQWQFVLSSNGGVGTPAVQGCHLEYTTYSTNGTLTSLPLAVRSKVTYMTVSWNADLNGETLLMEATYDNGTHWFEAHNGDAVYLPLEMNSSVMRWRAFIYSTGWSSPSLDDVTIDYSTTSYPHDVWLDIGNDGRREWTWQGELNWTYTVGGLENTLNELLAISSGDNVTLPIAVSSTTHGVVRINNLTILYNVPPVLKSSYPAGDNGTIPEGDSQRFSVYVYDRDNDQLSYVWRNNGKIVESISDDYTVTTGYSSGGVYNISVMVSDGFFTLNRTWTLTVRNVNRLPVMEYSPRSNIQINESETASFWITASDPDGENLTINWTLDNVLVSNTTSYDYRSDFNSSGTHVLGVNVTDGIDAIYHNWTIGVKNLNRRPVITGTDPAPAGFTEFRKGRSQYFNVTAHDPDGDKLIYVWKLNGKAVPNVFGARYLCQNGTTVGTNIVSVEISDGNSSVVQEWSVRVTAPPAPVVKPTNNNTGIIAGASILAILAIAGLVMWSRKGKRRDDDGEKLDEI